MPKIGARVFQAHIFDLCDRYNIGWCTLTGSGQYGQALIETREIETPEIKGRLSYATALHEIGHVVGPCQYPFFKTMQSELGAWRWARRNALIWSPGMEKHAQECLTYYRTVKKWGITNAELEDCRREGERSRLLRVIKRMKAEQRAFLATVMSGHIAEQPAAS